MKSKNPQVKEGTLKFLGRCVASSTSPILPAQVRPLAETLAVLLEDGFENARNEAATCLGTLMKMVGERPLNAIMDGLADVRKAKVKESYEKAVVKCKSPAAGPPKAAPAPKPTVKKTPVVSKPAVVDEEDAHPKNPANQAPSKAPVGSTTPFSVTVLTKSQQAKKPPVATNSASTAKKPPQAAPPKTKAAPPQTSGALDTFKYKHTPEDAETLATELLPSSIMTDLADANWKTRLAALEELVVWMETEIDKLDAEVVVRALAKKGWGEKNFQVCVTFFQALARSRLLMIYIRFRPNSMVFSLF